MASVWIIATTRALSGACYAADAILPSVTQGMMSMFYVP
jgi:hypothetical protein